MEALLQTQSEFILKPITIKNILLLSPGRWNEVDYTELEIQKAFNSTDWNDRKYTSLYLDHQDTKERGVGNWVGYIKNRTLQGSSLYGDLEIWNPMIGAYLSQAKAKFGVSATLAGKENKLLGRMEDFHFESFSIVTDPACKPAMINLANNPTLMVQNSDVKVVTMENEIKEDIIELESVKHQARREDIESVNDTKDFASALKAMKVDEKKAPGDYENLKSLADNPLFKEQIDGIISDERRHYHILEGMEAKKELMGSEVAGAFGTEPAVWDKKKKKDKELTELPSEETHALISMTENSDIKTTLKGGIKMPEIIENESVKVEELAKPKVPEKEAEKAEKKEDEKEELKCKSEDKKAEKAEDKEEMSSDAILNKVKEMSADELVSYTNFIKAHLNANKDSSAKEVYLAYEKSKKDKKSEKELSASDLLAAMDSRIASLKELDSSKKIESMETKIQELSAKVKTPDRKTLCVAFSNASDSSLGMLSFLQHRIN